MKVLKEKIEFYNRKFPISIDPIAEEKGKKKGITWAGWVQYKSCFLEFSVLFGVWKYIKEL